MREDFIFLVLCAVGGLIGHYAAIRPDDYGRYFLHKWQRHKIEEDGQYNGIRLLGGIMAVFWFGVLIALEYAPR